MMPGYRYPLSLNGVPRLWFDVGGRESNTLEAHVLEALVMQLAHRADADAITRELAAAPSGAIHTWLTQAGAQFELHVESPFGFRAVLGPLPLNRDVFETTGKAAWY